jgi:hypothetical protein
MSEEEKEKTTERPKIAKVKTFETTSLEEQFQNKTIRPIIKMQDELLILAFRSYIQNKKVLFNELSNGKKRLFIETALGKDLAFKSELKGMILGQFSLEEYQTYQSISSDCNKRIIGILKERFLSKISELS